MIARRLLLAAALAFAGFGCASAAGPVNTGLRVEPLEIVTAKGGVHHFQVEIAETDDAREIGLMNRHTLAPDRGMLFEFDMVGRQSFWMKDTLIPLDIIFIAPDGKIDSIAANARPLSLDPVMSKHGANGVLEIEGGLARKLGVKPGDKIKHPFFKDPPPPRWPS
jgi:uncharacterized membrane protein (UPF0127 family)